MAEKSMTWKAEAYGIVKDTEEWLNSFNCGTLQERIAAERASLILIEEMRKLIDRYELRIKMNIGQGVKGG